MHFDSERLNAKLNDAGLPPVTVVRESIDFLFGNAESKRLNTPVDEPVLEYSVDGELRGYAEYYPTGALKSVKPWSNARPHGVWQDFSESGHLLSQVQYVNGQKHGLVLRWHEDELLAFASECQGNVEIGSTVTWDTDGSMTTWRRKEASRDATAFICVDCRHATYWDGWDHAGFSERGFLYNEDGNFVISWDARDPAYVSIVGENVFPWMLTLEQKHLIENRLVPAPRGGHFLFANPGRCEKCKAPIAYPLPDCVYLWDPKRMIRSGPGENYPDGPLINYLTQ